MKKNFPIICIIMIILILITVYLFNYKRVERKKVEHMDYELDSMIGLEKLNLYYEAHLVNLDGECFIFDIYFKNGVNNKKLKQIEKSIKDFSESFDYNGDTYPGYINVSTNEGVVSIFLDLGNVLPQNEIISIQGVLKSINNVKEIEKVMINES